MNDRVGAGILACLVVVFLVLNFTLDDAGTLFLILAVAAGVGCGVLLARQRGR